MNYAANYRMPFYLKVDKHVNIVTKPFAVRYLGGLISGKKVDIRLQGASVKYV